jgi:Tetracyclin repressor-like, C-terminal domain
VCPVLSSTDSSCSGPGPDRQTGLEPTPLNLSIRSNVRTPADVPNGAGWCACRVAPVRRTAPRFPRDEGQAVGDVLTSLLATAGDTRPEQHVLQLWATAHGLIALQVVGRVEVDVDGLHALLEDALTDCLTRVLPGPQHSLSERETHVPEPADTALLNPHDPAGTA